MKEIMMKKIFWLLILLGALGLIACAPQTTPETLPEPSPSETAEPTNEPEPETTLPEPTNEPDPETAEGTDRPDPASPMPGELDPAKAEEYKAAIKQLVLQLEPSDNSLYENHYLKATLKNPTNMKIESYETFLRYPESDRTGAFFLRQTVLEGQISPIFYGEGPLDGNFSDYEVAGLGMFVYDGDRLIRLLYDRNTDSLQSAVLPKVEGPPFDERSLLPTIELRDLYGTGENYLTGNVTNPTDFTIDTYLVEYLDKVTNEVGSMYASEPIPPGETVTDLTSYDSTVADLDQIELLRIFARIMTDDGMYEFHYDTRLDYARFFPGQ